MHITVQNTRDESCLFKLVACARYDTVPVPLHLHLITGIRECLCCFHISHGTLWMNTERVRVSSKGQQTWTLLDVCLMDVWSRVRKGNKSSNMHTIIENISTSIRYCTLTCHYMYMHIHTHHPWSIPNVQIHAPISHSSPTFSWQYTPISQDYCYTEEERCASPQSLHRTCLCICLRSCRPGAIAWACIRKTNLLCVCVCDWLGCCRWLWLWWWEIEIPNAKKDWNNNAERHVKRT